MTNGTGSGSGTRSKAGHTAGPWHVAPGLETVRDSSEYQVCYVESDYHTIDESDANARLIAAAPELLDALKDVRDQVFRTDEHERLGMTIGAWEHVLAAIAKAEGRERGDNDNSGSAT